MTNTHSSLSLSPYSDIAGFSSLASRLRPGEVVRIIDHFHTLIDEAFTHPDIFLMERTSSGCVAACGLVEGTGGVAEPSRSGAESQLSMTDSSYGSVPDLSGETETWRHRTTPSKHIHQQLPDSNTSTNHQTFILKDPQTLRGPHSTLPVYSRLQLLH